MKGFGITVGCQDRRVGIMPRLLRLVHLLIERCGTQIFTAVSKQDFSIV